jgi:lipopolysaccharide export system permease protein
MKFTRYVLQNFFRVFFLILISCILIFVIVDFVGNIRTWLQRPSQDTIEYYLSYLPHMLYLIMPITLLLTVIVALGSMANHLELVAIKCAGRGVLRILFPVFIVGILISGFMFWLGEEILPDANHRRLELGTPSSNSDSKRIKDKTAFIYISADNITMYFRHYSSVSQRGSDVILLFFRKNQMYQRIDAKRMEWKNEEWVLSNGIQRRFTGGQINAVPFKIKKMATTIQTLPEDLINDRQSADEMNSTQLKRRIEILRRTGESTAQLETQWHFKFSGAFVNFFILIIGASLSHRYTRAGNLSHNIGIGLFIVFSYYVIIKIGLQMGENGFLSPWLGAWFGNILFGVISLMLLIRSLRL